MVLEGSVRRQGEQVRVTAQLVDARSGFHVWSETYDREMKDIFAIQDEIARAIGEKMKVQVVEAVAAAGVKPDTRNLTAYDHYLRGLALWQRRREAELWQAVEEFEQSIAADPGFASAYGGLALVHAVIADYSSRIHYEEAYARATDAAEMALALDPTLPEPYAALATIAVFERRRVTAQALFNRAIALRPSFATAYQWMGTGLMASGDPAAGLAALERATALDPRSVIVADNHAFVLFALGRYAEGRSVCERIIAFAPEFFGCQIRAGFAELLLGRHESARSFLLSAAATLNPGAEPLVHTLVDTLEGRGDRLAVAQRLAQFAPLDYVDPRSDTIFSDTEIPALLVLLGAPDLALDYLDDHSRQPISTLPWTMMLPALDPLRCQSRFREIQKRLAIDDQRAAKQCGEKAT
jgi:tetratricopeptide (TPR) repeat protein